MNFQSLELHIGLLTAGLIGPEQVVGQMVTTQLPFTKLCVLADSLFQYRFGKTSLGPSFAKQIGRSLKLEDRRNQLFHSAWLTDDVSGNLSRMKFSVKLGRGLSYTAPPMAASDVNLLADEMADAARAFLAFVPELEKLGLLRNTV